MQGHQVLHAPHRLLMGPGPSDAAPSVLKAMSMPLLGHLDPAFIQMMEEIKEMLRAVFRTRNSMTFPVSGTGSAGMEFCMVNLVEPGDEVEEATVRQTLLNEYDIEVGAGLGPLKGKIWRVGLMGESSRPENVDKLLLALKNILGR